jgi:hypothetical protein
VPLKNDSGRLEGVEMSDCIHCQIHDLLESDLQNPEVNLGDVAFKVTEVLADLILMVSPEDQGTMIAEILRNLGQLVLDKDGEAEDEDQSGRRRH